MDEVKATVEAVETFTVYYTGATRMGNFWSIGCLSLTKREAEGEIASRSGKVDEGKIVRIVLPNPAYSRKNEG